MGNHVINQSIENIYSLTPLQEGMLFHSLDNSLSSEYIVQNEFKAANSMDEDKVQAALQALAMKHPVLRTSIVYEKLSKPRQIVLKDRQIEFQVFDFSLLREEEKKEKYAELKKQDIERNFDLQKESLLRVKLIRHGADNNMMIFTYHHIIMDGWSLSILYGDFLRYYQMLMEGKTREALTIIVADEKSLLPDYGRYVQYLEKKDNAKDLAYWKELLAGYEDEARITPMVKSQKTEKQLAREEIKISKELCKKLQTLAQSSNVTLSSIMETAWAVTLGYYSNTQDVVFGKIVSGRNIAEIPNVEKVLGLFINTVPVRVQINKSKKIGELIDEVKAQDLESINYSHCALVDIQNLTVQKGRLINTLFVYENYYVDSAVMNLMKSKELGFEYEGGREETNYPITIAVKMNDKAQELIVSVLYNSNEYASSEIENMIKRLEKVLEYFAYHVSEQIREISLLLEEEEELIQSFNQTNTKYPKDCTVIELFEQQVRNYPDRIAAIFNQEKLTYKELNEKANRIANYLMTLGIGKNDVVGITTDRRINIITGLVGILKAGAAYLPLDTKNPKTRTQNLLYESSCNVALTFTDEDIYENVTSINLEKWDDTELSAENPQIVNHVEDTIYIIYTSGTTGMPKGVAVSHQNVVRLVKNTNYVDLSNPRILQTGSLAFDASTFEIWGALLNGGMVCITDSETLSSAEELQRLITQNKINILFLTTALFNQMIEINPNIFDGLSELMVGGEKMSERHVRKFREVNKKTKFCNIYGPTESTTYALFYPIGDIVPENVPLGKPISNTTAYVMKDAQLCGFGILGELCLGGDGIAKGYINSKELTEEKFLNNPFEPGKLLYRTGDLVCQLPDGNIDFRGRVDEQVKIRGFRIEPGEIMKSILEIPAVNEAFVLVKEKDRDKYLCAYIVTEKDIDGEYLKNELHKKLPEYMIPTYFVFVEKLPLNINGKVDKHSLPEPEIVLSNIYVETVSEKEKALAKVFEEVLKIQQVGALDSFFELGGDSIKAIRIVSKYRLEGFVTTVKDIMTKCSVRAIAAAAFYENQNNAYVQSEVTGTIPNTPIIHEFKNWNLKNPNGLTQSMVVETKCFEDTKIAQAFDLITSHHDMLRAVLSESNLEIPVGFKQQRYDLQVFDMPDKLMFDEEMEEKCTHLLDGMDIKHGPLVKVGYFKGKEKGFLFICIHHLIVDGVSWKVITEDLFQILDSLDKNRKVTLPKKTASFGEWAKALENYKNSNKVLKQKEYWRSISELVREHSLVLNESTSKEEASIFTITLKQDKTLALLRKARLAFHTETNELLLAAIGLAVNRLTGKDKIAVRLEGHGRENIDQDIDISRTVGWFTTMYPIIIDCSDEVRDTIISAKEMLRGIPNHGIGYGLLKEDYKIVEPNITFNYLGELEESHNQGDMRFCTIVEENDNDVFAGIGMNGFISGGSLSFNISYKGTVFSKESVRKFALEYEEALIRIIDYCLAMEETIRTPSDYSAADLTIASLQNINKKYKQKEITDIYSLTPLQEGMLFFKLSNPNSTGYVVQQILTIKNNINQVCVEQALDMLAFRYEILRASIVYENIPKPVQVILKERKIQFEVVDISDKKIEESLSLFEKIKKSDVDRGFELTEDSLLRVKLIYLPNSQIKMIWCFHHIIMDGWCMSFLYKDFIDFYKQLTNKVPQEVIRQEIELKHNQISDYGDYLRFIAEEDYEAGLEYWEETLSEYNGTADIIPLSKPKDSQEQVSRLSISMPADMSERLKKQAVKNNTTINTLLETALGILLMKYNYEEDVVFGKVVSGRDVESAGIEEMVGLFINTIPLRVKAHKSMTVLELMERVSKAGIESRKFSHCPLSEIQKRTNKKRDLFKILFVYENYYVDSTIGKGESGFNFEVEAAREQTDYPLTIAAYMDDTLSQLKVIFMFDPKVYAEDEIMVVFHRFKAVVDILSQNLEETVGNIEIILDYEKDLIKNQFNNTTIPYPREKSVIQLFEEQVSIRPNEIAAYANNESITYLELNKKSNQLAKTMQELGARAGDFIAIMSHKNIEVLISMCAILKLGGAYIPIDLKNPKDRIEYILADCKPRIILKYKSEVPANYQTIDLEDKRIWMQEEASNLDQYLADELAYIMYTSGSMGKPKGSMITNRGIVRLVKNTNFIELDNKITILQTGSIAFDAATLEIWGALLNGGKIVLADDELVFYPSLLKEAIEKFSVNTMWLTSALYNQLIQMDLTTFDSLQTLLVGGEKLSEKHVHMLRDRNKHITIINGYGPTENTTFTTTYKIPDDFDNIYIGQPISQTQVYILNDMRLCGIGIPGELCITGDGLSKGYLNQEQLTSQNFVKNPFGEGKMYRSGDLACWMPDGNIKFLGRMDEQVKVRGYRIELEEIDNVIKEQKGVLDVVTVVTEDNQGLKSLHSYFVASHEVNIGELRNALSEILPDYMIPLLMQIDEIPTTRNGKVDKQRLPVMVSKHEAEYQPPSNEKELAICKAFCNILGTKEVGINDNFFELGGDSIKAIRIVSFLRQQNYEITVKTVMSKYIVKNIAMAMYEKKIENSHDYEQGEVTGIIEDTPMIQEFKAMRLKAPHHYNQDFTMEIDTDDQGAIARVLDKICEHHDVLRAVYKEGRMQILPAAENKGYELYVCDLEQLQEQEVKNYCQSIHASMDLEKGPLLKAVLLKGTKKNYLFLCAHHLIIDGVSWRILLEDFRLLLSKVKCRDELTLPKKTASFILWSKFLQEFKRQEHKEELSYWTQIVSKITINGLLLSKPREKADRNRIQFTLSKANTSKLLKEAGKAFHTEINDLLVSALGIAYHKITCQNTLSLFMEGHGREELTKGIELDRTVGWFTCMYPVVLDHISDDIRSTIIATKEMFRRIPNHGAGYGLLKEELPDIRPDILFNYLGQIEDTGDSQMTFSGIGGSTAQENNSLSNISINGKVISDRLSFEIAYEQSMYAKEGMENFAACYESALNEIIEYCTKRERAEKTVSDYSAEDLNDTDLEIIYSQVSQIEQQGVIDNIYSLTSMQEDMLLQSTISKESTCYVVQEVFKTKYKFHTTVIKKAFDLLSKRHDVLRTVFVNDKLTKPRQVVLQAREIEYEQIDLSCLSEEEALYSLKTLIDNDVKRGFQLQKDSLLRVKYIIMGSGENRMIWTYHHIILDGWCMSLLFKEFFEYYSSLEKGEGFEVLKKGIEEKRNSSYDFGTYLEWLQKKDKTQAMEYWQKLLREYENTADIKPSCQAVPSKQQVKKFVTALPKEVSQRLEELAIKNNLTISTIFKAVWGVVLQRYNLVDDVVFGEVVSGRNTDELDVGNVIGLCINTIPVRVKSSETTTVLELLEELKQQSIESHNNSFCSLAEIQSLTLQKNNLIKNLCVYENYYVDEKAYDDMWRIFDMEMESSREQTDYPLNIVGYYDQSADSIKIVVMYDPSMYRNSNIERLVKHIESTITYFIDHPHGEIRNIGLASEEEKQIICETFNHTKLIYDREKTAIDLFEEQVLKVPDYAAVSFYNASLSYRELNEKANQVAFELRKNGVVPNDIIAVMAERSFEMIIAILGIMKAGAAFVPVDSTYPEERIQYILQDCAPKAVITSSSSFKNAKIPVIDLSRLEIWMNPKENLEVINKSNDLAYIIYTSGTTGNPKGVKLRHGGIVNMREYLRELYEVHQSDRILQFANYIFDAFMWEITISLFMGAELVLMDLDTIRDIEKFNQYVRDKHISIALLPPQYFLQTDISGLKVLTTGGSASNAALVKKALNNKKYINAYGPTENTVLATHWVYEEGMSIPDNIPIGKPMGNVRAYIVRENNLCGIEIPGELCIAGDGLAEGYLNQPELTNKAFINNPFGEGKLYRTGDLARWLPDGNIEYLGRNDDQVKIRGFRIEKGEIEAVFRKVNGIKDIVILDKADNSGEKNLFAYFVADRKLDQLSIRKDITKRLPAYMVPAYIIQIDSIPLTRSGKVDKEILSALEYTELTLEEDVRNEYEKTLKEIWKDILNLANISIFDNFYYIGGNSLKISNMFTRINQVYPDCLTIGDIFSNPTIASLAEQIEKNQVETLTLKQMVFPKEYFDQRKSVSSSYTNFKTIYEEAKDKLTKLYLKDEKDFFETILFVYGYLLNITTESDYITICGSYYDNYFTICDNFNSIDDLNELKHVLTKEFSSVKRYKNFRSRTIAAERGILPVLCYCPNNLIYKDIADYAIVVQVNHSKVEVELEIINNVVHKNAAKEFFQLFIIMLQKIM